MITQQTPWGVLGDLQVSKCLCLSVCLYLCVSVYLKPSTDFLCSAPEIEASPVDEPEPSSRFFGLCELQTNSVSHISQTVGEDPLGPAAVCSAARITRGLWSHSAAAHFAGKEWDDVMLFALHQHALIGCIMEEIGWGTNAIITPLSWFYGASSSYQKHDYSNSYCHTVYIYTVSCTPIYTLI